MAFSRARFTVVPNGQTLLVSVSVGGSAAAFYTDAALTSQVTAPAVISSDSTYYVADDGYGPHVVSCKQLDGSELYGVGLTRQQLMNGVTVAPLPSRAQVAVDLPSPDPLMPTGALAESFSRQGAAPVNSAMLSTGRMSVVAIRLRAGTTVTSISFHSATTAMSAGTNQWFALYNSGLALLGQTTDDTSTAWGSNTLKTLSLTTPYVTTYTGRHYVGINVTASTVPTIYGVTANGLLNQIAPIVSATSSSSLTSTAPDPAGALSGQTTTPWAFVS